MNDKNDSAAMYLVLQDIQRWTRVTAISLIANQISQELASDSQKLLVYHLSDGENSSRDIASMVRSVSHVTVTNYWKTWARIGIVEPSPWGGWRKVIELEELGIDAPKSAETTDTPSKTLETPRDDKSSYAKN